MNWLTLTIGQDLTADVGNDVSYSMAQPLKALHRLTLLIAVPALVAAGVAVGHLTREANHSTPETDAHASSVSTHLPEKSAEASHTENEPHTQVDLGLEQ